MFLVKRARGSSELFRMDAACGCSCGRIRSNNEDNFYFDGSILDAENEALHETLSTRVPLDRMRAFAVFDGMGGEQNGEYAAYAAAKTLRDDMERPLPRAAEEEDLLRLCLNMNRAVLEKSRELLSRHMGTTVAALFADSDRLWVCNLGDSRIFRLRGTELVQRSVDDVDTRPVGRRAQKPSLTQHLGIDEEDFLIEPHIMREEIRRGDCYLLCSDGLTDMVPEATILSILADNPSPAAAVETLIRTALEEGGRDNVTALVCRIC